MIKLTVISVLFSLCIDVLGQQVDSVSQINQTEGHLVRTKIIGGDTVLHVNLKPITIRPPMVFNSKREFNRYTRLVLYVQKVYPYSQIVSQQLFEIHAHLDEYKTEKQKKEYLKQKEKELKEQFEGQLRSLTFTQGKILIKLINRETGHTTFDIIKELKGSLNAFFWQSIARLFGSNLKLEYDAEGDDRMIEDIVIRIENGEL